MEVRTALVKYIFLDIVKYSHDRTVEAQVQIIEVLNKLVLQAIAPHKINPKSMIYLPTGDGLCICLINIIDPYDLHIKIAQDLLRLLNEYNASERDPKRKFNIRIGINENYDSLVVDINGRNNVAGAGINFAQRIMNMAEDNQIIVGQSVYEKLVQRELYFERFIAKSSETKHKVPLRYYHFVDRRATKAPRPHRVLEGIRNGLFVRMSGFWGKFRKAKG